MKCVILIMCNSDKKSAILMEKEKCKSDELFFSQKVKALHLTLHFLTEPAPGEATPQQSPSACSTALLPRLGHRATGQGVLG